MSLRRSIHRRGGRPSVTFGEIEVRSRSLLHVSPHAASRGRLMRRVCGKPSGAPHGAQRARRKSSVGGQAELTGGAPADCAGARSLAEAEGTTRDERRDCCYKRTSALPRTGCSSVSMRRRQVLSMPVEELTQAKGGYPDMAHRAWLSCVPSLTRRSTTFRWLRGAWAEPGELVARATDRKRSASVRRPAE